MTRTHSSNYTELSEVVLLSGHRDSCPDCVKGRGSAKAPLRCGRRSPQGLCSLKEGFRISEERVPVLGVIK